MKKVLPAFVFLLLFHVFVCSAETKIFEDPFREKLQDGWTWLREVPEDWRVTKEGLEIKMIPTPDTDRDVRNILFRKPPKITDGNFTITVELKASQPYGTQYQQAGIYWMQGDRYRVKFVMEMIDDKLCVFPGNKPLETEHVVLRLLVEGNTAVAEFQPNATGEFQEAFRRELPERDDNTDRIGLQCWHGPADKETWIRFSNFSITKPE